MPRKASWPPKISHHKTGQARVHWKGRDYWLGRYGSPEAERAYAELLQRLTKPDQTGLKPDSNRTKPDFSNICFAVVDIAARFLAAAEDDRQPVQLKLYASALAPLVRLFGTLPADEFDALHLEKVRGAMLDGSWMTADEKASRARRKQPAAWCRNYVRAQMRRLLTVWRWAERQRLAPRGSWANLRTLPPLRANQPGVRETPRRQGTTRGDLDAVLPHVQAGRRHRPCAAMLEIQWLAGMRSCEVCRMRPGDLDRETGPLVDGVRVWIYRVRAKGQERVIALGPAAQELIKPWLVKCPAADAYLFRPGGKDCPYSTPSYDANVRRACKRAGVKVVAYGGRHATATRVKAACGLDAARAVLGHASMTMTHEYGEALDLDAAARAAARLG